MGENTGDPVSTLTGTVGTGGGENTGDLASTHTGTVGTGRGEHRPSSFPSCSLRHGSKDSSSERGLLDTHICFHSRQGHLLINFKTYSPFNADNQSNTSEGNAKISQLVQKRCTESVPGILQAKILEWAAIPFSRGSSQPRDHAGGFFII